MSVKKPPFTPIPLFLLCGPLGAGKTTLLLQLLKYCKQRGLRAGVLMNEVGAVSVDGPLVANLVEEILEISGGCVCCDGSDEIVWGLKELLVDRQVDVVVLECSGIAQVGDVIDVITELNCRSLVRLTKVIGVIQPALKPKGQGPVVGYTDCVRYSDELVLNKRDLCSSDEWERFRGELVRDNGRARLWQTVHAEVNPEALLQSISPVRQPCLASMKHETGQESDFSALSSHPMVATVPLPRNLDRTRFLEWFENLPNGIERVKGFCRFADSTSLHEVQFSLPALRWVGTIQLQKEPNHALVLIGHGQDWKLCGDALHSCLIETNADMPLFPAFGNALQELGRPSSRNQNTRY